MPKIVIATPAYGEMFFTPYVESVFKLTRALDKRNWSSEFSSVSYFDVVESRNLLLTYWYDKTDASHLLFIDADMGFETQLIFDMIEFDKPVVGVIYPKKTIDLDRLATMVSSGQPPKRANASSHDFVVRRPLPGAARNGFIEAEGCGTGIFLIQRSCIDVMMKKLPEIIDSRGMEMPEIMNFGDGRRVPKAFDRSIRPFDYVSVNGQRLTEDYSFCHRWRHQCGGEIWANIAYEIVHMGPHRFRARYSDALAPRVRVIQTPLTNVRRVTASAQAASAGRNKPQEE